MLFRTLLVNNLLGINILDDEEEEEEVMMDGWMDGRMHACMGTNGAEWGVWGRVFLLFATVCYCDEGNENAGLLACLLA